jgi:hypothetical protein
MNAHASIDPFDAFNTRAQKDGWACRCDPSLDFAKPELTQVAALWRDKAGERLMPARSELDARSLKPFLANMTLLERVDGDPKRRFRVRLHGTALTRYAGDSTGQYIEDLVPGDLIDTYTGIYDLVLAERRPMRVLWDYQMPVISYLKGETFIAPLTGKEGLANILFSVTYIEMKDQAFR